MKRLNNLHWLVLPVLALGCIILIGCGGSDTDAGTDDGGVLPEGLFLTTAPQGISAVKDLKGSAQEGDEVVVRVVVGGTEADPLVQGRASAQIIDAGLDNHCLSEDDHCEKPWDYCCTAKEDKFPQMATLNVTDGQGKILPVGLDSKIQPGSTLVVKGLVASRVNQETLTINATGIFVEKMTLK